MLLGMRPSTLALAFTTFIAIPHAAADGETSPLLGGSVIGTASTNSPASAAGIQIEAAVWAHWFGIAAEVSANTWSGEVDDASKTVVVGGSVRFRVLQYTISSLLEPSDVELGVELQGILEKTVWTTDSMPTHEPYHRGLGLAIRLRGSTDDESLIAESRLFIRVLSWKQDDAPFAARTTQPPSADDQDYMVLVGIGAAFGGGERSYLRKFRRRAFE